MVLIIFDRVYLTSKEIVEALERLGCIDIKVVNLKGKMDTIENFIFGTGSSARHIKKMSDVLVRAVNEYCYIHTILINIVSK